MIVFCSTCKGRAQHIKQTLPRNLADNNLPDTKFVLLDYNSEDDLADYIKNNFSQEMANGKLVFYQLKEKASFKMAHAKNMAHRLGIMEGADILVNLDADNFTGKDFDKYILSKFNEGNDIFLWSEMIKEGEGRLTRGISGRIAVSKLAFINSGGYDEKYETYSPDDKDFNARLRRMGYLGVKIDNQFLKAIAHNDKMRFKEYKHVARVADEQEFHIDQFSRVVNYGKIGLGTVYKNFSPIPIEILPIATRIFGIGMHKTATTSFNKAMNILGFNGFHWNNAHLAKKIWTEITETKESPTLEKYYTACDLPIPLLFKELDVAYPNSKFVLTIRDENKWLESVRKHWSHEHNPFRHQWNNDPFTHKVHKLLYGQKGFDAEIFINRYRKHNQEVIEYFKNRSSDLFVLDMEKPVQWNDLCQFLNVFIPNIPYPKEFVTQKV